MRTPADRKRAAARSSAAHERLVTATRRRRQKRVGIAIGSVLVLIASLVVGKVAIGGSSPKSGQKAAPAARSVTAALAHVPASAFDSVGVGSGVTAPSARSGPALTAGGLPRVLYIGAEFCPYCAAERWPVVVALSRFGTFTGLGETTSSPSDVYPSTATLTFHGASYSSPYLSFTGKERQSNQASGAGYAMLDPISPADNALWQANQGGYPFVDIGGRYLVEGASYNPGLLAGKTQQQIAAALSDPSSPIAQAVLGTANELTAAICTTTGMRPASVCSSSGVTAAAARLSHG